jgi:hypothetical protein
MNLGIIIAVILGLLSAWLLISPHLVSSTDNTDQRRSNTLVEEKERLLQILRDLELDKDTYKISNEEFALMNQQIRAELGQVLEKISNERDSQS